MEDDGGQEGGKGGQSRCLYKPFFLSCYYLTYTISIVLHICLSLSSIVASVSAQMFIPWFWHQLLSQFH